MVQASDGIHHGSRAPKYIRQKKKTAVKSNPYAITDCMLLLFWLILWPSKLIESQNLSETPPNPTLSFADEETEAQRSV